MGRPVQVTEGRRRVFYILFDSTDPTNSSFLYPERTLCFTKPVSQTGPKAQPSLDPDVELQRKESLG